MSQVRRPELFSGFNDLANAGLIGFELLRRHHAALVIQYHATNVIGDALRRLQHQLEVLVRVAIGGHIIKIEMPGVEKSDISSGLKEPGLTMLARLNSTGPLPAGLR